MASGPEHYKRAEELLAMGNTQTAEAQVHATLALAAATVDVGMTYDGSIGDEYQWAEVTL